MISRRGFLTSTCSVALAGCTGINDSQNISCSVETSAPRKQYRISQSNNLSISSRIKQRSRIQVYSRFIPQAQPVLSDSIVFAPTFDGFSAIKPDGKRRWTFQQNDDRFRTTPVATCGTLFVAGTQATYAIDEQSGELLWESNTQGSLVTQRSPLFANEKLFILNNGVEAVRPQSGEQLWRWDEIGQPTGVAFSDGLYVAMVPRGDTQAYGLVQLDPTSGEIVWRTNRVSAVRQPPVIHNNRLAVVDATTGNLLIIHIDKSHSVTRIAVAATVPEKVLPPTLTDEFIIVSEPPPDGSKTMCYGFDGDLRWCVETGPVEHSPIITKSGVIVCSRTQSPRVIDVETGETRDRLNPLGSVEFPPAVGSDQMVFAGRDEIVTVELE